ncbi:DEAD/DEAH box helicase [Paenibacillus sp. PL2-23]|uniref:DEAD/DEAH box helicase n=1 Tax=Paenibacillus sp. PL2-23 TaxID=2100729 RepID=UPI004046DFA6
MNFEDLKLKPDILKALAQEQYEAPTPIQEEAIPPVLEGRDLLGCAQTGTGKTAAFSLPIIQRLSEQGQGGKQRLIRALILTPTRELALQISDNIHAYSRYVDLRCVAIVGGVSQSGQERALAQGTDILIATPGRLMDLMNQKVINLGSIEVLVLDEADRMLDMGFINDVKKIILKIPAQRQTLFFSATMPPEIAQLADSLLVDPVKVEITPVSSTVERISQSVYFVDKPNKQKLLGDLLQDASIASALVFTRTKHGADRVARGLNKIGVTAQAIHGDKSQNSRQNALNNFKNGTTRVLVATDIAARGIDVEELSHVINFNLPNIPETYVHRIGRTGRAGHSGVAISFCEGEEIPYLKDIEKLIKKKVPVVEEHAYPMTEATPPTAAAKQAEASASGQPSEEQAGAGQKKKRKRRKKGQAGQGEGTALDGQAGQPAQAAQALNTGQPQQKAERRPKPANVGASDADHGGRPKASADRQDGRQQQGAGERAGGQQPKQRNAEGQQGGQQPSKQRRQEPAQKQPAQGGSAPRSRRPQPLMSSRQEIHQESGKVISVMSAPWANFKPKKR